LTPNIQVEALHGRLFGTRQTNGACIVDQHIDRSETLARCCDRLDNLRFVTDVHLERQALATGRLDLLGRRVNRAWQARVLLLGFAAITTLAPSEAARSAIASPMPASHRL